MRIISVISVLALAFSWSNSPYAQRRLNWVGCFEVDLRHWNQRFTATTSTRDCVATCKKWTDSPYATRVSGGVCRCTHLTDFKNKGYVHPQFCSSRPAPNNTCGANSLYSDVYKVCPEGTYGKRCKGRCPCAEDGTCDEASGPCSRCHPGSTETGCPSRGCLRGNGACQQICYPSSQTSQCGCLPGFKKDALNASQCICGAEERRTINAKRTRITLPSCLNSFEEPFGDKPSSVTNCSTIVQMPLKSVDECLKQACERQANAVNVHDSVCDLQRCPKAEIIPSFEKENVTAVFIKIRPSGVEVEAVKIGDTNRTVYVGLWIAAAVCVTSAFSFLIFKKCGNFRVANSLLNMTESNTKCGQEKDGLRASVENIYDKIDERDITTTTTTAHECQGHRVSEDPDVVKSATQTNDFQPYGSKFSDPETPQNESTSHPLLPARDKRGSSLQGTTRGKERSSAPNTALTSSVSTPRDTMRINLDHQDHSRSMNQSRSFQAWRAPNERNNLVQNNSRQTNSSVTTTNDMRRNREMKPWNSTTMPADTNVKKHTRQVPPIKIESFYLTTVAGQPSPDHSDEAYLVPVQAPPPYLEVIAD